MTLMAQDMREQPAVLARLVDRFDADVERVKTVVPDPLGGVTFVAATTPPSSAATWPSWPAAVLRGWPRRACSRSTTRASTTAASSRRAQPVGETPEIVDGLRAVEGGRRRTIAIVNDADTPLAEAADVTVAVDAGPSGRCPRPRP